MGVARAWLSIDCCATAQARQNASSKGHYSISRCGSYTALLQQAFGFENFSCSHSCLLVSLRLWLPSRQAGCAVQERRHVTGISSLGIASAGRQL